jgi:DNA primase
LDLKDPDDIARANPKLWRESVNSSISVYEFLLRVSTSHYDPSTPEGKRQIITDLAPVFSQIHHAVEKDFYIKKLAGILEVKKDLVEDDLKKVVKVKSQGVVSPKTIKLAKKITKKEKLERYLVFLLLNFSGDEISHKALEIINFNFSVGEIKPFLDQLVKFEQVQLKEVMAKLPEDIKTVISEIYLNPTYTQHIEELSIQEEWDTILQRLKKEIVRDQIKQITVELDQIGQKAQSSSADEARQLELLQQIVELKRK